MTRYQMRIAGFAAAYFVVTSLTVGLTRFDGGLALVWFGSAIAALMLTSLPRACWLHGLLAIVAVSSVATALFGFGPRVALPMALTNAFEAWLVARMLLALRPGRDWLDNVGGLTALVFAGGVVAPAVAAVPGGLVASFAAPGPWYLHASKWWAAHGLGTVIGFSIAFLALGVPWTQVAARWTRRLGFELAGFLCLIGSTAYAAMSQALLPLLFLPIVPLLLASYRCGREGAAFGMLVIAVIAVLHQGEGTLIGSLALTMSQKALFLQFYLAVITLLAIPLSVALRQHQRILVELEERRALKQLIAEYSDDALLNLDEKGRIRFASPAAARLSGVEDLEGAPLTLFFDPLDEALVRGSLAQAAAAPGETVDMERAVLREEEQLWLEAKICAVALNDKPGDLRGYAVTIRDITARKQTELDAIQAAATDQLTGLANRRALLGQLDQALAHAEQRPFALAILDLDHFKAINDTHGHVTGDQVLREVSATMCRMSSPSRLFARLGGEEFALISRQASFESAIELCEQLRKAIGELRFTSHDGTGFGVTASIGCTRIDRGGTAAQALQAADALLYHAKHAGRNRVEAMPWKGERRVIRRAA